MSDRNRAFTRPTKGANANASDYVNNLRAKVKFAGTSNLARTVAAQGGVLPLRTPKGHLKPYQGTYGFSATTLTANSPKTYCLNTSRSYRDLLDITKGKYLLTPPNPVANTITIDNTEPSELYNGVFFENTYVGNAVSIYSTSAFGIDNNNIIYTTSNPLAPSNSNQLIFVDPSYNMFYESQSCLDNITYFKNIEIRTDLGVNGKEQLDRVLNLYLLNGFKYPSKFSLDYYPGECINANNDLQTPPPLIPPCPPCSLDTIATEGPANTWTTNSNITILPCQTLTILVGQTLNIDNNLNNYGIIQNSGTIITNNGLFTNYSGGIINNNVGGVINNNLGTGFLQNDLGGTINNNGTFFAGFANNDGTINNNATGLINIQSNALTSHGIITNNTGGVIYVYSGLTTYSGATLTNHIGATINNSGTIINDSTFTNFGTITTTTNTAIITNTATITNSASGVINIVSSSSINNTGTGTITNAGTIAASTGGVITNTGTITNSNTITANSGTITNNSGGIINNTNSGTITTNSSSINNIAGGTINNNAGGIININIASGISNFGTITNSVGGAITNSGTIINDSTFTNFGIITNVLVIQNSALLTNDGASATITNAGTITNFSGGTITNTNSATINNNIGGNITNNSGAIINNKFSGIITNNIGATFANTTATFNNHVSQGAVFHPYGTYTGNPVNNI
jgi:hypothetical protein